jgi:hypothetical protein
MRQNAQSDAGVARSDPGVGAVVLFTVTAIVLLIFELRYLH